MGGLDGCGHRVQVRLPHWPSGGCRCQQVVKVLAKATRLFHDAKGRRITEPLQRSGNPRFDQSCQFGEPRQVAVVLKILDRLVRRPFIQRIDKIEGWMATAPFKTIGATSHLFLAQCHVPS
ncbi:hypothetical protein LMTR3_29425 [Bradyrhizobium sp. LMTR 3]|nr:hypothetical protein LMTR3_29425 [Bradyrhizobium sp. LMTR 3]